MHYALCPNFSQKTDFIFYAKPLYRNTFNLRNKLLKSLMIFFFRKKFTMSAIIHEIATNFEVIIYVKTNNFCLRI